MMRLHTEMCAVFYFYFFIITFSRKGNSCGGMGYLHICFIYDRHLGRSGLPLYIDHRHFSDLLWDQAL